MNIAAETSYPSVFPCPSWQYDFDTTAHNRRVVFDSGWTRQRRRWAGFSAFINMQFVMNTATFDDWANWVDKVGSNWFSINLDNYQGSPRSVTCRVIGPMTWQYTAHDTITANLQAESAGG